MKKTILSLIIASTGLVAGSAFAQEVSPVSKTAGFEGVSAAVCKLVTKQEVQGLFTRWNQSLATLKPANVVANYSDDAVLLPTVSNTPRTNHAEINDYFVHFLQKKPQGVINKSVVKIGCNEATDVGVYTFTLRDPKTNQAQTVHARYSFVYEYEHGKWLISHHHSSAMPEAMSVTAKKSLHDL